MRTIVDCQNTIDEDISVLKADISSLISKKQNIIRNSDIDKIEERIDKAMGNKEKIKEETEKNMMGINYKGLYAVALKYAGKYESKESLSHQAESAITPLAVEDLNGVFVSSLTRVKDASVVRDYVMGRITGSMSVGKTHLASANRKSRIFRYVAKVVVSPLKESPKKDVAGSGSSQNVVFDLCAAGDYDRRMTDFGVASRNLKNITQLRDMYCASVRKENEAESVREKTIMRESVRKLGEIDGIIARLRVDMDAKQKELSKIYADLNFNCVKEPKDCIEDSKILVDRRIDGLHAELLGTKENELIERHTTTHSRG